MLEWIHSIKRDGLRRIARGLSFAGLVLGLIAPSLAGAQSAVVSTPQVRAELVAHAPQGVQPGQPLWLGLQLRHEPEWHTYWRNPGDSGLPTQLEWNLPAGLQAGNVMWPLPSKLRAGSLTNYGFEKTVLLGVPVTVSPQYQPGDTLEVQLQANWLVCRLECIPQEGHFVLRLPTQSSHVPQAAAFDALMKQQPQRMQTLAVNSGFEGQQLVLKVQGLPAAMQGQRLRVFPLMPEVLASATEQHPLSQQGWEGDTWTVRLPQSTQRMAEPASLKLLLVREAEPRTAVEIQAGISSPWPEVVNTPSPDVPSQSAATGWGFWGALLGALAGGLILNLMPCVLPVLAIKLMGFAKHSRQHRAQRVAGLTYTAGVVLSFLALGAAVLALRSAGEQLGWGFQLQSPWVVITLALLFTLIALNLFGLFEIALVLPSPLMALQARHPVLDALLSGVLAVAVASPCTAPFMGASLGLALTLPSWQALSIFAALGLGLALPYLLASFWPALVQWLPQPGPWMIKLRQLLGFPMLATVIWLLWVLGLQAGHNSSSTLLASLLLMAAWMWAGRLHSLAGRVLRWMLLAALLASLWVLQQDVRASHATSSDATTASLSPNNATEPARSPTGWQPWSEASVAQYLKQGRPVFVDFTAAWCVTCQLNKKTTLSNDKVLSDFAAHNVALLRADWTRHDPAITEALSRLGRSGVPVYVLYAPDRAPHVLSELLTPGQVRDALAGLPN